ncbi:helix-turn-helix domain-containing protein [Psychrobacillus sp. L3]|uniref:helix-turn-helix domain-containing protein n=1 Tax=Psychrobacillus sp. L3 TaxID=3236891 RepID=UPI0036F41217
MERTKNYTTWESLPDTLTAQHISQFLGISRRRVYELFLVHVEQGGIPNFEIGASKRVEKSDLKNWIAHRKEKNSIDELNSSVRKY